MGKVKTLDDLRKLREDLKSKTALRDKSEASESMVQVKVAMATCCIASGSREIMNFLAEVLDKRNIEAVVTQTGCMGYCYAEPTIEVTLPGKEPIIFGYVDQNVLNVLNHVSLRAVMVVEELVKFIV